MVGVVIAAFVGFVIFTLYKFSCWVVKHRNPFSYAGLLMEDDDLQDKRPRGDLSVLQSSL